jgi:probable metal-binding protein
MNNVIHVHDVLDILRSSPQEYSIDGLLTHLNEKYGEEVRFTNCAERLLSIDQLLSFLTERGKVELRNGKVILLAKEACS